MLSTGGSDRYRDVSARLPDRLRQQQPEADDETGTENQPYLRPREAHPAQVVPAHCQTGSLVLSSATTGTSAPTVPWPWAGS